MEKENCVVCKDGYTCGHKYVCGARCISWSAIFVAALVALGLGFLLNLFSIAIGLSAYRMTPEGAQSLAMGGVVGLAIGGIAIMFFAGWIAGFLGRSRCYNHSCGGLYGFTTWCLALVITILLAAHVAKFVTTYKNFIAHPTYSSVQVTDNTAAPTVSTAPTANGDVAVVNPEKIAMDTFVVFLLFFLGALACTFGGHCGMRTCCKREERADVINPKL